MQRNKDFRVSACISGEHWLQAANIVYREMHLRLSQAFFFDAGKITQGQNNSRSEITQGFFSK